jgi:hypothetical protein
MARISGRKGRIYLDIPGTGAATPLPFVAKWSLSAATAQLDVTAMDDSNKVYISDMPDASGDFSGFYDDATAQTYTAASTACRASSTCTRTRTPPPVLLRHRQRRLRRSTVASVRRSPCRQVVRGHVDQEGRLANVAWKVRVGGTPGATRRPDARRNRGC